MAKTIKLKDGRTLAYEEYGDPEGKPVFYFHGWPASRLSGMHYSESAKRANTRLICCDRPGYGLSTFKKDRKLLDWPDDICELADHLGLRKFSIIGASGGGPYVSSCAFKIPQRLNSAIVSAGLGPLKIRNPQGLTSKQKSYLKLASFLGSKSLPTLLLYKFCIDHFFFPLRKYFMFLNSQPDKEIAQKKGFKKTQELSFKEAFKQGIKGPYEDLKIYSSDWGFDLKDIKMKVLLFHGMLDRNAPFWMGKYVASQIPNCKTIFYPKEGHFLIVSRGEEILSKL